jgi:type I restriction enzyme S subunit
VWSQGPTYLKYQKALHRVRLPEGIAGRWVMYSLMRDASTGRLSRRFTGSTIAHLPREKLMEYEVTIPPAAEQQRIVEMLDAHFSRLDAAVAGLDAAQRRLKAYRSSVLKAALEGRLVPTEAELARKEGRSYESANVLLERILKERRRLWEDAELAKMKAAGKAPKDDRWKATYPEPERPDTHYLPSLPEGWCWATVDQLSAKVFYGSSAKAGEESDGVPILRMGNIIVGSLDLSFLKYLPLGHEEFPDLLLESGDLLFNRTNSPELVGKTAVYTGTPSPCSFASYLICVRFLMGVEPQWVAHVINSPFGRQWVWRVVTQQVGQANVNGSKLKALAIPLPPSEEQRRCVSTTDMLFSNADVLQGTVQREVLRISRLRQSILKLAFEGRLTDQGQDDEPADALLARIRAERSASEPAIRKPRRARKRKAAS